MHGFAWQLKILYNTCMATLKYNKWHNYNDSSVRLPCTKLDFDQILTLFTINMLLKRQKRTWNMFTNTYTRVTTNTSKDFSVFERVTTSNHTL